MKKRIYRKVHVNNVSLEQLRACGDEVVFAVDVAKREMVAVFATSTGAVVSTVWWTAPRENRDVLALLTALRDEGRRVEVVMEPSGSYDDALRHQLQAELPVYRVQGKRTHDAMELHDGVPSLHDAKSAAILARLHKEGISRRWEPEDAGRRGLKAALSVMDLHRGNLQRLHGLLESQLARYWPELDDVVDQTSATVLALLARIGGPRDVAADADQARKLMRGMSRRLMKDERIESIIDAATTSVGVVPVAAERAALMTLAAEAHRTLRAFKSAQRQVEALSEALVPKDLPPLIGKATAAVVIAEVGDPASYGSARSFLKACGLNLREKSSGTKRGELHLTKRGSSKVRAYLWLAALRLLWTDDVVRAWYAKKVARDGGRKKKAVVALMRKLAKAMYVVSAGEEFDATKLFDVSRLDVKPRTLDAIGRNRAA